RPASSTLLPYTTLFRSRSANPTRPPAAPSSSATATRPPPTRWPADATGAPAGGSERGHRPRARLDPPGALAGQGARHAVIGEGQDRKSTRLNSSHQIIS